MAKMFTIVGQVVTYDTHIKGGKWPDGVEYDIRVEMDCSGATEAQLLTVVCTTSARVTLSKNLREDINCVEVLKKYDRTNNPDAPLYKVKLVDIISGASAVSPVDVMLTMSEEDFISTMMMHFGQNEDQAKKLYKKKHGI